MRIQAEGLFHLNASAFTLNGRRLIDAGPEVHCAQLLAAAGLGVQEQLRAVVRDATEHEVDHESPARAGSDDQRVEPGA
jgi:hypothetical protein